MFVNSQFLKWDVKPEGFTLENISLVERPWSLFSRAEEKLAVDISYDSRGEVFFALKRAVDRRLKGIEQIYEFTKISYPKTFKSNSRLELLEYLGIIRPLLIKNLLKIRNDIEHQDVRPPSKKVCEEFIDTTWYFLKSTDFLVMRKMSDLLFEKYDQKKEETVYYVSVRFEDFKFESMQISGWFPKNYVRQNSADPKFIEVENCRIEEKVNSARKNYENLLETDLFICGNIPLNSDQRLNLIRLILRQSV